MKQTENNKMDLLLRDLARRERAEAATPRAFESSSKRETSRIGDQSHSTHLDADELSSYAEGALPEMTRARYTAHLADCQRCRNLVTELALAAGVNTAVRPVEKAASSSLWKKLSAFFSPPVLRYAVPALALFAVIAVALIGLRERQEAPFVAQNSETAARGTVSDTKAPNEPATASATPFADALAKKQVESVKTAASNTAVSNEDKKKLAEKEEVAKREVAATSISGSLAKDSPAPKPSDAEAQPTFAAEPPPAPPAKEQVKTADARRADEVRQQEQVAGERDAVTARTREEQLRPGTKGDQNTSAPQAPVTARRAKPLGVVGRGSSAGGVTMDGSDDVRTVGGRRFRRQGQTWIDTAYDASHSAISVVRGSEQYRALVADEPGIRTIAEQLQGEVVLVWKGRTYRIR